MRDTEKRRAYMKTYNAAYRAANPEKEKARTATWYAANRSRASATNRAWHLANPGKAKTRGAAWHATNPLRARELARSGRLRFFGLTLSDYDQILAEQGGKCYLCGTFPKSGGRRLAVDHDHKTGVRRALLCTNCNTGMGKLGDSPELLRAAANYIERFKI